MAIPTTSSSAQLLLILAFLFLGLWSSTFKIAGNRWRFELFSIDFAVGSVALTLLAAYFLGSFGSDIGFNEHLMLASRTSQVWAIIAGGLFAFGNILLLAACALLGISFAYALTTATILIVLSAFSFNAERLYFLPVAIVAALITLVVQARGAGRGNDTLPGANLPGELRKTPTGRTVKVKQARAVKNSTKGAMAAIIGGLALGVSFIPFNAGLFGQFGLGPFAGLVVFSLALLGSTLVLNLLFMNLPIQGSRIGFRSYLTGGIMPHLLGIIGGALCTAGILFLFVVSAFPSEFQPDRAWLPAAGAGASLIAVVLGLSIWRELSEAPGAVMRSMLLGTLFLAVAVGVFSVAMEKGPPPASAPPKPLQQRLPD